MAKARKKRRTRLKKQSLAKNVALLLLSVFILAGASVLFSMLNTRPEYSCEPIEKNLSKMVSKAREKAAAETAKPGPQEGSAGSFEYSFWDILLLPDKGASPGQGYGVQIASFDSREAALELAGSLESKNRLTCEVTPLDGVFVVRWGSFRTREVAERYCRTLSGRLRTGCTVVKP